MTQRELQWPISVPTRKPSCRIYGQSHVGDLPDLLPVTLWFSGASLPFDSPPVRSPTAPATPPPPPVANFACATGIGPGFVMVVIVAAGIISVDMANIGTPAGGDLAPSVTGRYGNRLAGIQLHSSSRGKLVGLFFVFVRRWFNLTSARDYHSRKASHLRSPLQLLAGATSSISLLLGTTFAY